MTTIEPSLDQTNDSCATDRSCAGAGCGCTTAGEDQSSAPTRRGLKAGLLAAACAVACLAVPFAVGAAAVSGAVAGEWWLLVGLAVAAVVVSAAVVRRRRTGKLC